jgi:hypothetical protein
MKRLLKITMMLENDPLDKANRSWRDSVISGQTNRIKPKLAFTFRRFDMDVWPLVPLVGVKMKSK